MEEPSEVAMPIVLVCALMQWLVNQVCIHTVGSSEIDYATLVVATGVGVLEVFQGPISDMHMEGGKLAST